MRDTVLCPSCMAIRAVLPEGVAVLSPGPACAEPASVAAGKRPLILLATCAVGGVQSAGPVRTWLERPLARQRQSGSVRQQDRF